jgi:hypothetical protein
MIINKRYEFTLDIRSPINFAVDVPGNTKILLDQAFHRKNYMGGFIVEITSIIAISPIRIQKTNLSAHGFVDVIFEANTEIYSQWDIITGAEIKTTEPIITAELSEPVPVIASVKPDKTTKPFRVGQKNTLRVIQAWYKPFTSYINLYTHMLKCDLKAPVYTIKGNINSTCVATLVPLMIDIEQELRMRQQLMTHNSETVMFFESLLYSYSMPINKSSSDEKQEMNTLQTWNDVPEWTGPPSLQTGFVYDNILAVISSAVEKPIVMSGTFSRDISIYRSSPLIRRYQTPPDDAIENNTTIVLIEFLTSILTYLTTIRKMSELYSTVEIRDEYESIWTTMRNARLPSA